MPLEQVLWDCDAHFFKILITGKEWQYNMITIGGCLMYYPLYE